MDLGNESSAREIVTVLFMDIVGYSLKSIDDQADVLTILQTAVRESAEFQQQRAKEELLSLPTGDGMAIVFLGDPVAPAKCALEISAALRNHPEVELRMGINTGLVSRHADIKKEANVVGSGINLAQRVMDCGDAGHILLSQAAADVLGQIRGWENSLQDLGVVAVKHGIQIHVYNLCKDGFGNPALPHKLAKRPLFRWKVAAAIAAGVVALAFAFFLYWRVNTTRALADQRWLQYYVIVQKYRDGMPYEEPFRLSGERIFEADYRVRLVFSSPQAGYLYILNEGPASTPERPVFNTLFPSPLMNGASALLQPGQELKVPEGGPFVFDQKRGTEKLWLVWSKRSLPELEALKRWVNYTDRGAIGDQAELLATEAFLAKYGRLAQRVTRNDVEKISILEGTGEILAYLLSLDHE